MTQSHDANGNLTLGALPSEPTQTYQWDAFNRLRKVYEGMTLLAEYQYDAGHRRMGRTTQTHEDRWSTMYAHDFIHDDWQVIEERMRGWLPKRQFVYGAFIDEPLVMDVNENFDATCTGAGDSRYFYHQDRIYSVIGLTDAVGTIVEAYEYDPYGRRYVFNDGDADGAVEFDGSDTVTLDAASAFGNPYVFTGRRWEDETGLHYYRRRWYDAPRARFLSRDPIGFGDGPHLYQYVKSNPLIYTDSLGLKGCLRGEMKLNKTEVRSNKVHSTSLIPGATKAVSHVLLASDFASIFGNIGKNPQNLLGALVSSIGPDVSSIFKFLAQQQDKPNLTYNVEGYMWVEECVCKWSGLKFEIVEPTAPTHRSNIVGTIAERHIAELISTAHKTVLNAYIQKYQWRTRKHNRFWEQP